MEGNKSMGNNEGNVSDTLAQRGSVYGPYSGVVKTRTDLMSILKRHYKAVNRSEMSDEMEIFLGDLVLKLVRGTGAPEYSDSWHDLAGYATLVEGLAKDASEGGYKL